jgi:DNA-binding transcriptional LysR family regulator
MVPGLCAARGIEVPELKHLRYFIAVAEELNFSAAARREYVSQQALSRIIQQLEAELGVVLFERTTRSVSLTPAGAAMLAAARRSAAAADEAFEAARRAQRGEVTRPLRIELGSGVLETAAQISRRVRRDHPQIALRHTAMGGTKGIDALLDSRLDAVLGLGSETPPSVRAQLIRLESLLIAVSAEHPLAARETVALAELDGQELLLPSEESGSDWNQFVSIACAQAGVTIRRSPSTVHGATVTAELLRDSLVVLPTLRWVDPPGGIAFRPIVEPELRFPWSMMTPSVSGAHHEIEALLESAQNLAHEQSWISPAEDEPLPASWPTESGPET